MTQRDIAKDKEGVTPYYFLLGEDHPLVEITIHYINAVEALEARVSELEALLHPNNRPDVVTRLGHDTALETVFRELEELRE